MLAQATGRANLDISRFTIKLNFSHHRNKLFNTPTSSFLFYVTLLIWITTLLSYLSLPTLADSQPDNSEPIRGDDRSEAEQLYCQHCLLNCLDAAKFSSQQQIKPSLLTEQNKYQQDANRGQQSSSRTVHNLACSCKSVFDTKKQAITCKNVSSAVSELVISKNNNHSVSPHLKAKAFARAETKTSAVNSTKMPINS